MYKNKMNLKYICLFLLVIFFTGSVAMATENKKNEVVDSNIVKRQNAPQEIFLDPLSATSLYIILADGDKPLATATGFVIREKELNYLITNWHVLSGRHPRTNKVSHPSGKTPNQVWIWHHSKKLGIWKLKKEKLYDESGKKRWKEHRSGRKIDIVALPLDAVSDDIQLYPFDLSLSKTDMVPQVAMPVSIIGFPLGLSGPGRFPIWKTGHIASEPDLDYNNDPVFLIDATTRGGMSGSPVVLRLSGNYKTKSGNTILASSGIRTLFLGVYSGRIHEDSEIGKVWRPQLIEEIIENTNP